MTLRLPQNFSDNDIWQQVNCLSEKFVVDFANGIDIVQDHIRTTKERSFFRRVKEALSGESAARQNAINASLSRGVEASLQWLTELTTSLATTNYALTQVNDRLNSLVNDTATLAHYSADTREQLHSLARQVNQKINYLEEELRRVDLLQRAQFHLDEIFSCWKVGRYTSLSFAGRCYVVFEELWWGEFGDVIRHGEPGQVKQLLNILRNNALHQLKQDSNCDADEFRNVQYWLGGQERMLSDNKWNEAINWLGDWCSQERHPVIWSVTQDSKNLPVRMPRFCSAERITKSMVEEIFLRGRA
ncbi:TPA: diguanylate cyclase regulator RdcB family protein [Escherichia coli]|jgi:hypothetical protein|uniref:Chemotaxis protein n=1 Tax=Escherichia marmotae TaxID=1499973 RepID=A0A7W3AJH0_9ESCH|nr:diguanylate cyclase regulator RdcB family protein [Escherichia marmotae]MBA7898509.1 chemotaxis protein [Escherichia marmotae]QLW52496.1 chemotaxis protein [Escherichia marmotae]